MTVGSTSFNEVVKTVDGWPFYHYGRKAWSGGNSLPGQVNKTKVFKKYSLKTYEIINGRKVLVVKDVLRSRLVPLRNRRLSPNGYTASGFEMYQDDFKVGIANSGTWSGGVINEPPFQTFWTSNDDIALLGNLRERIAGSSFNAAVTTAESVKSLKMISESATRIRKFYTNFRKGNFTRAADELFAGRKLPKPSRRATSQWLELKYGWLPLINDVQEGARFLAYTHSPRVFRVEASRNAGGIRLRDLDLHYWGLPFSWGNVDLNVSHQESKRIVATLTETNLPALVGLEDPLSVVWELMPYSFVIDWFIPVGNYLQARALTQSLSGSYVTTYRKRAKMNFLWVNQTSGNETMIFKKRADLARYEQYEFSRTISSSIPNPPLPKIKDLSRVPSWNKAITSVALLLNLKR